MTEIEGSVDCVYGIFPASQSGGEFHLTGAASQALVNFSEEHPEKLDRNSNGILPRNGCFSFHLRGSCGVHAEKPFSNVGRARSELPYKAHGGLIHAPPRRTVRKVTSAQQQANLNKWKDTFKNNDGAQKVRFNTCKGFADDLPDWIQGNTV